MTIKTKLLIGFFSISAIIIIAGVLGIVQIKMLYTQTRELGIKTSPLADAVMEVKLTATTAHLWLEEIIGNIEDKEKMEDVWKLLDKSLWYANAILEGGQSENGIFYAVNDDTIETKIRSLKEDLGEIKKRAQQRFDSHFSDKQLDDRALDNKFDALFAKFNQTADEAEEMLHVKIVRETQNTKDSANHATLILIIANILSFILAAFSIFYLSRDIIRQIGGEPAEIAKITEQVAAGNLNLQFEATSQAATGIYASVQIMVKNLKKITEEREKQDWLKTGQTELSKTMRGEQNLLTLTQNVINFLAAYMKAAVGVFYLAQPDCFKLISSYAYKIRNNNYTEFKLGEGLVGQAALEKKSIVYTHLPQEHINLTINSGLGETFPLNIFVLPLILEDNVLGVLELGTSNDFGDTEIEFLDRIANDIAITLNSTHSRVRMQELLAESQNQKQTLQAQQDKLQTSNEELQAQQEELQAQNEELQSQQEELQTQQEELRHANEELEERTRQLEKQKTEVQDKNLTLEQTQKAIEDKAQELELASRYKSEFLANMSHELRTPLNSMLILAQLLAENKRGNLDDKQVEYARTISGAGADLLSLINEILDLSKVEAGKTEINRENFSLTDLVKTVEQKFRPLAEEKGLAFHITMADQIPPVLNTDAQRLKQIINNLLSNAFKFTTRGEVKLNISKGDNLVKGVRSVSFAVTDTGIGIPKDKQQIIFEAFQQADGSTNRRYGGTGLGLTISRQLARLLGGDIHLHSEEGKGSTFTLYLPDVAPPQQLSASAQTVTHSPASKPAEETMAFDKTVSPPVLDDRNSLHPEDKIILIVEDDHNFSKVLIDLAREKNFKCILAEDGQTGLQLATEYAPHAIILDISLPQLDGWTVMERLKDNPHTRHIPVHFMSAYDHRKDAKQKGAIGYLLKPINMEQLTTAFKRIERFIAKAVKNLLVVIADETRQGKILELVSDEEVQTKVAVTRAEAFKQLHLTSYDGIILDIDIEQGAGIQFLEQLQSDESLSQIPVIIYAGRELTQQEQVIVHQYENNLTLKAVSSPGRLLEEVTLFLHQVEATLPKEKRKMLQMVHNKEAILKQKKVLIVDDDTRNTFALLTILEDKDMVVVAGKNGKEALELLEEHSDIDIVLMDIMMPEMDGYEAIQKIRAQPHLRKLPIIALTAKAMKGDKAKCIEAGANDYLAKPVDIDKLISLMRVWLYR
jgi:signal transduction histidine kinase/CheY-like chemotaxis protein